MAEDLVTVRVSGGSRLRVTRALLTAMEAAGAVYLDANEGWRATCAISVTGAPSEEETLLSKTQTADFFEPHLSPDVLVHRVNDFWRLLNERARELAGDYPFGEKPTAWDLLHSITASLEGTDSACDFWRDIAQELSLLKDVNPAEAEPGLYWGRSKSHGYFLFMRTEHGLLYRLVSDRVWEAYARLPDDGLYFRGPLRNPGQVAEWVRKQGDDHLGLLPKGDADARNAG